jgi:hypothetical protein
MMHPSQPARPASPSPQNAPIAPMTKPGTVIGIQVMLWLFIALGALGEAYSYTQLTALPMLLRVFLLINGALMTIQGLVSPVHIGRGRRWARNWAFVNAVIGLILSLLVIIEAVTAFEVPLLPTIIGVASAGLQGTLLGLLCSKSARRWILVHRVQDGRVPVASVPVGLLNGIAPASIGEVEGERPRRKPAGVALVQIAVCLIALFPVAPAYVLISSVRFDRAAYPSLYSDSTLWEQLLKEERGIVIAWCLMMIVFLVLAVISIAGLQRGRSWVRAYSPIWLGIVAVLAGMTAVDAIQWLGDPGSYRYSAITRPAKLTMSIASIATSVLAVCSFVMMFTPGVRSWTPRLKVVLAVGEAGSRPPEQAGPSTVPPHPGYPPQQPADNSRPGA